MAFSIPSSWKFAFVLFLLVVVQLGFGSYAVILRKFAQSNNVDPLVFSLFRDTACFPVLWIAAVLLEGFHPPRVSHFLLFFGLGLTGMFGNQVFFIFGLYETNSTIASIFQPMIPVLTVAFAMLTGIEQFFCNRFTNWAKLWGVFSSGGGAVIMVMAQGHIGAGSSSFLGYLFLLGNTSSMAVYVLLQKKFLFKKNQFGEEEKLYPPITATAYSYAMGALVMGIACIPYGIIKPQAFDNLTVEILIPLTYAIFISSALCYGLIGYSTSVTSATIVTAFWPLQVVVAALESFFVFGDIPTWEQLVGAGFILAGLVAVCAAKYIEEKDERNSAINDIDD